MRKPTCWFAIVVVALLALPCYADSNSTESDESSPFTAQLSAHFSEEGLAPDEVLSLTEMLKAAPHLDDFRIVVEVTRSGVVGEMRARFAFDSFSEIAEWEESGSIQALLKTVQKLSSGPVRLDAYGDMSED